MGGNCGRVHRDGVYASSLPECPPISLVPALCGPMTEAASARCEGFWCLAVTSVEGKCDRIRREGGSEIDRDFAAPIW